MARLARLKRWLFGGAALLSLAAAVVAAWAWAWVRGAEGDYWITPEYGLIASRGRVGVRHVLMLRPPPEATTLELVRSRPMVRKEAIGFECGHGEEVPYVDLFAIGRPSFVHLYAAVRYLNVPDWAVVAGGLVLPAWWAVRFRRGRRRARLARGCCVRCGNDLQASVGRCLECGTPVASVPQSNRGRRWA